MDSAPTDCNGPLFDHAIFLTVAHGAPFLPVAVAVAQRKHFLKRRTTPRAWKMAWRNPRLMAREAAPTFSDERS